MGFLFLLQKVSILTQKMFYINADLAKIYFRYLSAPLNDGLRNIFSGCNE